MKKAEKTQKNEKNCLTKRWGYDSIWKLSARAAMYLVN